MSCRPSAVSMRQPLARVKCVGSSPTRSPNSASGRLLPVDAPPGIIAAARGRHTFSSDRSKSSMAIALTRTRPLRRPSRSPLSALERSRDLDRHGAQELDLARIRSSAKDEGSKGPQHEILVARLEEVDRDERALDVREEPL